MSEELERGPDGSPPGHIEKMLGQTRGEEQPAAVETPAGEQQVIGSRPENVPEKYWDADKGEVNTDALLKTAAAYDEARAQPKEEVKEEPKEGNETPADTSTQANVVQAASAEWDEKGELTEDTIKSLETVGISREMVNMYLDGMNAIVNDLQQAAYGPFEGKEGYDKAAQWAAESLSESEIRALDLQLTSSNPEIVAEGAKSLLARFQRDGSYEPPALRGGGNVNTGSVYRSRAEMVRDMNDHRYRTDAGFRKEVEEKLRRSKLARG